jgi:hypothetical protein
MLDRICPTWQWFIRNIEIIKDEVIVTGSLTIDGITRDGVGSEKLDTKSQAPPVKTAERDALKRAATWFGVARELYHKTVDKSDMIFPPKSKSNLPTRNTDGICEKVPASVISKEEKSNYTALLFAVNGIKFPIKVFVGGKNNPTTEEVADDLNIPDGQGFPWQCLVDVKPRDTDVGHKYDTIVKFYPAD